MSSTKDTFQARRTLHVGDQTYFFYSLERLDAAGIAVQRLPYSLKILLENLLRREDGESVDADDVKALASWQAKNVGEREISFKPARVVLQDFTGVPCVVDLAAMRGAMRALGGDPKKINPLVPVDLVIDHSVQVDYFGSGDAFRAQRRARVRAQPRALRVPALGTDRRSTTSASCRPIRGIVHQVNLEYLARVVFDGSDQRVAVAFPDSLVGTDSHTTMINGLGVVGWGVGGIEAEAVMLGQPMYMLMPEVVGFKLDRRAARGRDRHRSRADRHADAAQEGVVGKFVEFFGGGCRAVARRPGDASPTWRRNTARPCGFFPVDDETLDYLRFTGREGRRIELVEPMQRSKVFRTDARPTRNTRTRCRSTSARSSRASPGPSGRRIACRLPRMKKVCARGAAELRAAAKRRLGRRSGRVRHADGRGRGSSRSATARSSSPRSRAAPTPAIRRVMIGAGLLARKRSSEG